MKFFVRVYWISLSAKWLPRSSLKSKRMINEFRIEMSMIVPTNGNWNHRHRNYPNGCENHGFEKNSIHPFAFVICLGQKSSRIFVCIWSSRNIFHSFHRKRDIIWIKSFGIWIKGFTFVIDVRQLIQSWIDLWSWQICNHAQIQRTKESHELINCIQSLLEIDQHESIKKRQAWYKDAQYR